MNDDQRRHLKRFFGFIVVGLIGLAGLNYLEVQREKAALARAEATEKQRKEDHAKQEEQEALNELLRKFSQGDRDTISRIMNACITAAESSSRISMMAEYRDYQKVEAALRNLHPYDTERMIEYVTTPKLNEAAFFSLLAQQTIERHEKTGEASLMFAVTYAQDTFNGLMDAYAILNCPLRGSKPHEPWVDVLYIE